LDKAFYSSADIENWWRLNCKPSKFNTNTIRAANAGVAVKSKRKSNTRALEFECLTNLPGWILFF
jgi:hypothetical protein